MADIIATGTSGYATGAIDTATTLINGVSPRDAKHPNGCAAAAIQIEAILGSGTTLKGSVTDLATRLSLLLDATGRLILTGFSGLTIDRGLLAISSTTMAVINHTPIGIIQPFAGSVTPTHWLFCNGLAISRLTYAKLFAVIGTIYGAGDGISTFNLPDLRGRIPLGLDGGIGRITVASTNGTNANTLGGVGGAETHTLIEANIPSHTHQQSVEGTDVASHAQYLSGGSDGTWRISGVAQAVVGSATSTPISTLGGSGSGTAHSNTQPWIAVNYIIFVAV